MEGYLIGQEEGLKHSGPVLESCKMQLEAMQLFITTETWNERDAIFKNVGRYLEAIPN
jgi:hypothetical protein